VALDVPFGSIATALACLGIMFSKWLLLAIAFPVISNAFIIDWELSFYSESFWLSVATIALGELVVMVAGYIIFMILMRIKMFLKAIKANQNLEENF